MKQILLRLMQKSIYVSIFTDDRNKSCFSFGKIIGVDNNYYALSMVSPEGNFDGVLIKSFDHIVRIEENTKYCRKIQILKELNGVNICESKIETED